MTAPTLERMKFWIVVPKYAENQIKNPTFASPDYEEDWTAEGSGVTIEETSDGSRWGIYSMQVNTVSAVASGAYYPSLTVENGESYTFSCYVKGTVGQAMRIEIRQLTTVKATTTFTATGYWQRVEVTYTAPGNASDYRVYVIRDAVASTNVFYVDGAQFEQGSVATTFFDGYSPGCHWIGAIRNSTSARTDNTGLGGELLCINDYASITKHIGFGMGQWNQVMTKMTSGGDMYQTHTRRSRTVALNVAYTGANHGELQAKRKVILDALRPDLLSNLPVREQFGINMPGSWRGHEQRILRYQGFDASGKEATNPVDIICAFESCHTDTPETETSQQDTLIFTVPSGLFQGAYQEGKGLDLYAEFPANYVIKRDFQGNWAQWTGTEYETLLNGADDGYGLNNYVWDITEGPDGKIYFCGAFTNAGGVAEADYIARWNPVTEAWEAVGAPNSGLGVSISRINQMTFDANGDLYVGGIFTNLAGLADADYVAKYTVSTDTWSAVAGGINSQVFDLQISPEGVVYIGGQFTSASGDADCKYIAYLDGGVWTPLNTGLNNTVYALKFMPDGQLVIGGYFTNADGADGDYICKWDGTNFTPMWQPSADSGIELNNGVISIDITTSGQVVIGGDFTDAGGDLNADRVAIWQGNNWSALSAGGCSGRVYQVRVDSDNSIYISGAFDYAGSLSLSDKVVIYRNGSFQPVECDFPGATSYMYATLPASDGSVYFGGSFSTIVSGEDAKTGVIALNFALTSASANTYPVISISGPGTLNSIKNYRTGKSVVFAGLTLGTGEWISLNFDPLNLSFRGGWTGRGNLMRYIIPGSNYGDFYLSPGANYISLFMGEDADSNTKAGIVWVPKFWGIEGALL